MKTGRNDPCPCGSGKKFKKCCGADIPRAAREIFAPMPEDMKTNTKLDLYMEAFRMLLFYAESCKKDPKHGTVLRKISREFEELYKPGQEGGLTDSFYMNWFVLDNRFGVEQHTATERFLQEDMCRDLDDELKEAFFGLSESYATCHQIKETRSESIVFEEIGTGRLWTVNRIGDPDEKDAFPGDIWHARFVGPSDDAYCFGQPYLFEKSAKKNFSEIVENVINSFKEYASTRSIEFSMPRDAFKSGAIFWAGYLHKSMMFASEQAPGDISEPKERRPALCNTDGDKIRFCKVIFNILEKQGIASGLSRMRGLEEEEKDKDRWVWTKKGNRRMKSWENTLLGHVSIRGDELVGEVNSLERALRLKNKLAKGLGKMVKYANIEGSDPGAMPPMSEKDRKKIRDEQRSFMADPLVRKALDEKQKEYYLKDWIRSRIPALEGRTPKEALKTREGRLMLEDLINEMEAMGQVSTAAIRQTDMNFLRKALGLPLAKRDNSG
ncbi:MAG: SEC-C metal-binding domain-containing protein [Candidatus Omnitrophota bacterium]